MQFSEDATESDRKSARVLLIGFPDAEQENIKVTLDQKNWSVIKSFDLDHSFSLVFERRFDVVIFDIDHIEYFAPAAIAKARGSRGASADTTMVAVGGLIPAGFKTQLLDAGADLVFEKPHDPKLYLPNFTRAANSRLSFDPIDEALDAFCTTAIIQTPTLPDLE